MTPIEQHYKPIEKLFLALYFASQNLRVYMILVVVCVFVKIGLIKYMLTRPIIRDQISKWVLALMEFSLYYLPQQVVKG